MVILQVHFLLLLLEAGKIRQTYIKHVKVEKESLVAEFRLRQIAKPATFSQKTKPLLR